MNIVVLDAYTLNPGDLDWSPLAKMGKLSLFDRTEASQVLERSKNAEVLIVNKTVINQSLLEQLPHLKYIGISATGYDQIDLHAAKNAGITITNVPQYGTDAVAQHTFALMLELCNRVGLHDSSVKKGDWARNPDWCYWKSPLIELAGKTLGIVGMGKIGHKMATIAQAFGMNVIVFSRRSLRNDRDNFEYVNLKKLFSQSDFVSLHCPLTPETQGFIDYHLLSQMKPSAFLINTARGKLINEADLYKALQDKVLAGAALDVLPEEPPTIDNKLVGLENCILTPHCAWASWDARKRLMDTVIDNLEQFLAKKPQNVVSLL